MRLTACLAAAALAVAIIPGAGISQTVTGEVRSAVRGTPVAGAVVHSWRSGARVTTDDGGRFVIDFQAFPDTLEVRALGFRPHRVVVDESGHIRVRLEDLPVRLPAVVASGESFELSRSGNIDWKLPSELLEVVPFGVETDPLRSLRLIPSVAFTSPLSGRPIIRGYDAWESLTHIDGFEVVNPYHLGRIFSAMPPGLASDVEVTLGPGDVAVGETNAASIDVTTEPAPGGEFAGGAELSIVSAAAWLNGTGGPVRWAGGGRVAHLETLLSGVADFPYTFSDAYLTAESPLLGGRARAVGFRSRDRLINETTGEGMEWGNLLAGIVIERGFGTSVNASVRSSVSRFSEDVFDGPFRDEVIDVENRFDRWSLRGRVEARVGRHTLLAGLGLESRDIINQIASASDSPSPPRFDRRERLDVLQAHGYLAGSASVGKLGIHGGVRVDDGPGEVVVQPRLRLTVGGGSTWYGQLAVGRTGRHYHVLAERIPEPELLFVDFWLPSGTEGVPVAKVDHASLDIGIAVSDRLSSRLAAFASSGTGIGEITPFWVTTREPFRFGKSRTWGLEAHAVAGDPAGRSSLSGTYVVSWSQRDWGDGWVRWSFDQRHRARVHGVLAVGPARLFALGEVASGAPITPPTQLILLPDVDVSGHRFSRTDDLVEFALLFGPENSATGPGTAFLDVGVTFAFGGPGSSRWKASLAVLNATASGVAPGRPPREGSLRLSSTSVNPQALGEAVAVPYGRLFDMPPVPSLLLSVEF